MDTAIDIPLPESMAAWPRSDDASPSTASTFFAAGAPGGPLRLEVACREARHAVDAVLALAACEELLCELQAWTGLPLDWRWAAAPRRHAGAPGLASANWSVSRTDDDVHAVHGVLEVPWTMLRELPEPEGVLGRRLQWTARPAMLAISQWCADDGEFSLLEPGGAIVLSESFDEGWHGLMRAADEPAMHGLGVPFAMPWPRPGVVSAGRARPILPSDAHPAWVPCEVRINMPPLHADVLAGWRAGMALPAAGPRASLWRCDGDHGAAKRLADGMLMPWGEGCALFIDTVCDRTAAA